MENTTKIEQVDANVNKLYAGIKVSKTVEQSTVVSFMGLLGDLAETLKQIDYLKSAVAEKIDLIASIAAVQEYTEEEIAAIEKMVQIDDATKKVFLAEIREKTEAKRKAGSVEVIGEVTKETFIQKPVEEPAAPVDPKPVTVEEPTGEAVAE